MKKTLFTALLLVVGFGGCTNHYAKNLDVPNDSNKLFASNNWQPVNKQNIPFDKVVK